VNTEDHEQSYIAIAQEFITNFSIGDLPAPVEQFKMHILACLLMLVLMLIWRLCRSKGQEGMLNINKEF